MNVAIVGGGPSALATALALIDLGFKPTIITKLNSEPKVESSKPKRRKYFGKRTVHNFEDHFSVPYSNCNFDTDTFYPISNNLGGLSKIWGANLDFHPESQLSQPGDLVSSKERVLHFVPLTEGAGNSPRATRHLRFRRGKPTRLLGWRFDLLSSQLACASKSTGCILCGKCHIKCPEQVIFNASSLILDLYAKELVNLHDGFVVSIDNVDGIKTISLKADSGSRDSNRELRFDAVFVAAGSISSSILLQRSAIIPRKVIVCDTQANFLPILSVLKGLVTPSFTLATLFAKLTTTKTGNTVSHMSLLELNPEYVEEIRKASNSIFGLLPEWCFQYAYGAVLFLEMENSGRLEIRTDCIGKTHLIEKNPKRSLRRFIRIYFVFTFFAATLLRRGLIPIYPMKKSARVTESFHVGSVRDADDKLIFDDFGRSLQSINSKIFVTDASSMPKIAPGPITLDIMIHAYSLVNRVFLAKLIR